MKLAGLHLALEAHPATSALLARLGSSKTLPVPAAVMAAALGSIPAPRHVHHQISASLARLESTKVLRHRRAALSALLAGQTPTATARPIACSVMPVTLRMPAPHLVKPAQLELQMKIRMLPPSAQPAVPDTMLVRAPAHAFTAPLDTTTMTVIRQLRVMAMTAGVLQGRTP